MARIFRLFPIVGNNTLVDNTPDPHTVITEGGDVVGSYFKLGSGLTNKVRVTCKNTTTFTGGIKIAMELYFEDDFTGGYFIYKNGSFNISITGGKLNIESLTFPVEDIDGVTAPKYNYYPVAVDYYPGRIAVPLQKWVKIIIAYDQSTGRLTTTINGRTDIDLYRYRGLELLRINTANSFRFFEAFKNVRIKSISLDNGRPLVNPPSLEVVGTFIEARNVFAFIFTKIDAALTLPLEITITKDSIWNGQSTVVYNGNLNTRNQTVIEIDASALAEGIKFFNITVTSVQREAFKRGFQIAKRLNTSNYKINSNKQLTKAGTPIFPIGIYHAVPSDFAELASYGFNIVYNGLNLESRGITAPAEFRITLAECLTAAETNGLGLFANGNAHEPKLGNIPALAGNNAAAGLYFVDEPDTQFREILAQSHATTKMVDQKGFITLGSFNKFERILQNSLPDCLMPDGYAIPNITVRMVADATKTSIAQSANLKPVWYVLPCYIYESETKIPTLAQLRVMIWIAIANGATGIFLYTWDDRKPVGGVLTGYYTKNTPATVTVIQTAFQELAAQSAKLLLPKATVQPVLSLANPAVHFLVIEGSGQRYLILANDSEVTAQAITLTFSSNSTVSIPCILDGGANTALSMVAGEITTTLAPHQAAVYNLGGVTMI